MHQYKKHDSQETPLLTSSKQIAPDFFIIGVQKSGTTWLWEMLEQHPGTSLPAEKEIHYFGSTELFAKGDDWYYSYFSGLDPDKATGEASTSYFYDRIPYWYNKSDQIEFDESLPPLPESIDRKFPDAKFIVILRDPVRRAISAYSHWMKQGNLSPTLGLKRIATEMPKMRIIEFGLYAKYLDAWMKQIPADRFRVILFEEQIMKNWNQTLYDTYDYLGLEPNFKPVHPENPSHKSWGWNRIVFNYYAGKLFRNIHNSTISKLIGRVDFLSNNAIHREDIEYLRSCYLPEKEKIASLLGRDLSCWDYGEKLLQ